MTSLRLIPVLVVSLAVLTLSWTVSRSGPLTFSITIPNGVHVHIDNPQILNKSLSSPRVSKPIAAKAPQPPARKFLPEPKNSILNAITAFSQYLHTAELRLERKRERFDRLPAAHRTLAQEIGYEAHFLEAQAGAEVNSRFFNNVAGYARDMYEFAHGQEADEVRYEIVDDFLGHVARDWTEAGAAERAQVHPPILKALRTGFASMSERKNLKILVPGSGMGRLAHEIANDENYEVDACELDYGSIIGYRYLLNYTSSPFQYTLHPFIKDWTHRGTSSGRFRAIQFPDMLPSSPVNLVEGDFLREFPLAEQYDAIVTLFFIDTSDNIVDFLANIHRLLKPGGLWINLGPLMWGKWSQMQLSADETLQLAESLGFDVDRGSHTSIDTVYAHQPESLLKFTYVTQFWTARKRN